MSAPLFAVSLEDDDLANESRDERLKGLETQNIAIRERLSKIEGLLSARPKDRTSSNPLLVAFLTIVGAAAIACLGWIGVELVQQGKDIASCR